MRLSVWCAEEYPFASQEVIAAEAVKYPQIMGLSPAVFDAEICSIWAARPATAIESQPVRNDVPVLLISGEYDYDTPPKWAAGMQQELTNSFHLIFRDGNIYPLPIGKIPAPWK